MLVVIPKCLYFPVVLKAEIYCTNIQDSRWIIVVLSECSLFAVSSFKAGLLITTDFLVV